MGALLKAESGAAAKALMKSYVEPAIGRCNSHHHRRLQAASSRPPLGRKLLRRPGSPKTLNRKLGLSQKFLSSGVGHGLFSLQLST
jgi:hypothetical protein